MPEIFAINGAFGAVPTGWALTPNGNYGAPRAGCPKDRQVGAEGCRHPAAIALQTALRQVGQSVSVDGFVGPLTATAVNTVLGTNLSPEQVAAQAPDLTQTVKQKIDARGGATPAPPPPAPSIPPVPGTDPRAAQGPSSAAGWALVGLSALAAGTGIWFTATR